MLRDELPGQMKSIAELRAEADRLFDDSAFADGEAASKTRGQHSDIDNQAELVHSKLNDRLQHMEDALVEASATRDNLSIAASIKLNSITFLLRGW
jgi:hypothetical protein